MLHYIGSGLINLFLSNAKQNYCYFKNAEVLSVVNVFRWLVGRVGDPHHVDADPDPAYHFDADPDVDPDPDFYI